MISPSLAGEDPYFRRSASYFTDSYRSQLDLAFLTPWHRFTFT